MTDRPIPLVGARCRRALTLATTSALVLLASAAPARAHEAPDEGAEWLMADWMFMVFLVFFLVALLAFVVSLRRGYLSGLEDAKYHVLEIDEPDYYTPWWAREEAQPHVETADSAGPGRADGQ